MNADHADSIAAMAMHYIGLDAIDSAQMTSLDRLGFGIALTRKGQKMRMRMPFPRAALDRADVKNLVIEMSKASLLIYSELFFYLSRAFLLDIVQHIVTTERFSTIAGECGGGQSVPRGARGRRKV